MDKPLLLTLNFIEMKARFILMAVLSAILFTSSAGIHSLTQAPIANSPTVTLDQHNFHVVKHV